MTAIDNRMFKLIIKCLMTGQTWLTFILLSLSVFLSIFNFLEEEEEEEVEEVFLTSKNTSSSSSSSSSSEEEEEEEVFLTSSSSSTSSLCLPD